MEELFAQIFCHATNGKLPLLSPQQRQSVADLMVQFRDGRVRNSLQGKIHKAIHELAED